MQNSALLELFSFGSICVLVFCLLFLVVELFKIKNPVKTYIEKYHSQIIFFIAAGATFGSVLLSIYFKFPPCELCWYQRMFLFPIPIMAFIATLKQHTETRLYIFVLSFIGAAIALYHSLLQLSIFKTVPAFCNPNSVVDCATPTFVYFGFVTIPLISFSVFLLLMICSYEYKKK